MRWLGEQRHEMEWTYKVEVISGNTAYYRNVALGCSVFQATTLYLYHTSN